VHPRSDGQPVLRLRGITKRFGDLVANDNITLDFFAGEVVALLGENGAGKSTLMSILAGHYVADEGTVEVFGAPLPPGSTAAALKAGIGMVHQHFTLAGNMTVLDNVIVGTEPLFRARSHRAAARERLIALINSFGLHVVPDSRISGLSLGERQRVEILKALYRNSRILILDEPTAVLTPQEAGSLRKTLQRLVSEGMTVIFISHKLDEVLELADRIIVLRSGKVVGEAVPNTTDSSSLALMMLGRSVGPPTRHARSKGEVRLSLENVSARNLRGGGVGLRNVSLAVHAHEIVGIAGIAGNGQSELASLLCGTTRAEEGIYVLDGENVTSAGARALVMQGVGRVPEDRHASGLFGDMTVAETLVAERYRTPPFSSQGVMHWSAVRRFAERIVSEYSVSCEHVDAPARLLSGGNLQKLILGRAFANTPRFIVANQPSRGLDVGAAAYVQGRLLAARDEGAAVLLISDDLDEILQMADRIAVMFRGNLGPALPREMVTAEGLGLAMAGEAPGSVNAA
jgi:simple sugar transport system ATP-binding protein